MKYRASLDKLSKIITVSVSAVFVLTVFVCFAIYSSDKLLVLLITPLLLIIIYLIVFIVKPSSYYISDKAVLIDRVIGKKEILFRQIENISVIHKDEVKGAIRIFGVGGLFGYFGQYSNAKFGRMTWYVTNMDQLVLITTINKRTVLISPDDSEQFIKTFISKK